MLGLLTVCLLWYSVNGKSSWSALSLFGASRDKQTARVGGVVLGAATSSAGKANKGTGSSLSSSPSSSSSSWTFWPSNATKKSNSVPYDTDDPTVLGYNPIITDNLPCSDGGGLHGGKSVSSKQNEVQLRQAEHVQEELHRLWHPKEYKAQHKRLPRWMHSLPRLAVNMDPVVNFKIRQRIQKFGAGITLGMDYLSDVAHWRMYMVVEDYVVGGRFSLRGSELGWTKTWLWNLGMGESEENGAKFKLRLGLNLKTCKAYARLRFRTEPISPFGLDIGEGLTCVGKLPLPTGGLLPVIRSIPLRVEYRLRVNAPRYPRGGLVDTPEADGGGVLQRAFGVGTGARGRQALGKVGVELPAAAVAAGQTATNPSRYDNTLSWSTGIDAIEISVDELNFCLEWDERSPLWDIGLVTGQGRWKPKSQAKAYKQSSRRQGRAAIKPSSPDKPADREKARMRAAHARAAARAAAARNMGISSQSSSSLSQPSLVGLDGVTRSVPRWD